MCLKTVNLSGQLEGILTSKMSYTLDVFPTDQKSWCLKKRKKKTQQCTTTKFTKKNHISCENAQTFADYLLHRLSRVLVRTRMFCCCVFLLFYKEETRILEYLWDKMYNYNSSNSKIPLQIPWAHNWYSINTKQHYCC